MKFPVGWKFTKDGIHYRVVVGERPRCEGDRVIDIKTDGWVRPKIEHTLLMADFKYHVEENNYGSGKNGSPVGGVMRASGWQKLKWALIDTFSAGWETVAARIDREAKDAAERRNNSTHTDQRK